MTPRKRPALRAVKDGDAEPAKKAAPRKAPAKRSPAKAAPKSVEEAAKSGDRRQLLVALGNRVAKALDDPSTSGAPFAALVKQARDLADAIAVIDQAAEAASMQPGGSKSAIADTPDESWDESYI